MITLTTAAELRAWATEQKRAGLTIGFVPTMGFLHDGHTSLMDQARPLCDKLVVSVYVNPLQFGPDEDLDVYPRDAAGDTQRCLDHGVDCLFMPEHLYPAGFATHVAVHGLTDRLCGASRPGHFEGVTTVVARLLGLSRADVAVFGEKDYQQLTVIRRMVLDLALPTRVVPGTLVRDTDGLALSSRNVYLAPEQRHRALTLHQALFRLRDAAAAGQLDGSTLVRDAMAIIDADELEYLDLVDAELLTPLATVDRPARALVAARYGGTRLIDNVAVGPELSWDLR